MLLEGLDEIGMTLQLEADISDYENKSEFNMKNIKRSKKLLI